MIVPKDIYLYLTQFVDNTTILNMLLVNKKFYNDPKFFERMIRVKYPLLIEFKKNPFKVTFFRHSNHRLIQFFLGKFSSFNNSTKGK